MLDEYTISDSAFKESRRIWVWKSRVPSPTVCLFLDGELYLDRVMAVDRLELMSPSCTSVFLSYGTSEDRGVDFTCNSTFTQFLVEKLIPWIEENVQSGVKVVLCGLSLSGIAALFAAGQYPNRFVGILAQSPSAWWNEEWLVQNCSFEGLSAIRIWLSVGNEEREENVTHSPVNLYQRVSQIDSCRKLARKIEESGGVIRYQEFEGGHDPLCWAKELAPALNWLVDSENR